MESLRERKKARTHRALAEAARALFLSRGFATVTIEEIVARAGVSRRTFFRYFPTKEAAFFADQADRLDRFGVGMASRAAAAPGAPAWTHARDALMDLAGDYMADVPAALRWNAELQSSEALRAEDLRLDAEWEASIVAFLEGAGATPLTAHVQAGALMGVTRAALRHWHAVGGEVDLLALGADAFRALSDGLDAVAEGGVASP